MLHLKYRLALARITGLKWWPDAEIMDRTGYWRKIGRLPDLFGTKYFRADNFFFRIGSSFVFRRLLFSGLLLIRGEENETRRWRRETKFNFKALWSHVFFRTGWKLKERSDFSNCTENELLRKQRETREPTRHLFFISGDRKSDTKGGIHLLSCYKQILKSLALADVGAFSSAERFVFYGSLDESYCPPLSHPLRLLSKATIVIGPLIRLSILAHGERYS